jgi:hypothetical protein
MQMFLQAQILQHGSPFLAFRVPHHCLNKIWFAILFSPLFLETVTEECHETLKHDDTNHVIISTSLVVRAMGCDGNGGYGNIIAGLEWIAANKQMPAVVSMSITTPTSVSLDQAVNNLVATSGVTVVAAAGNFAQNTCNYSPGRASVSFRHVVLVFFLSLALSSCL